MASVHTVIVIKHEDFASIEEAKAKLDTLDANQEQALAKFINYLAGLSGGMSSADVELTIRDTDPAVATSGSGSVQRDYNLK